MTEQRKPVEVKLVEPEGERSARMKPLAVLPLFYTLQDRRVVVAGGGHAAAWKAELLSAAGAQVEIHAPEISDAMENLLAAHARKGRLHLHRKAWSGEELTGTKLAVLETDHEGEAAAFHQAGQAAGVPVNVIDMPQYCDFQFGSIVNRSPVVIGISTFGVAPILGQAIRRRVETLLAPRLAGWAALAGRLRTGVKQHLETSAQRRWFWEHFVNLAFSEHEPEAHDENLPKLIERTSQMEKSRVGRVTLVGAGPGEAELLTLKAVRALQAADVILFDDLVSEDVLELARREAKRMMVGKRGGRASTRQTDINDLMIDLARGGKSIVRLKSGDPTVFGRAGEEIECLRAAGIEVTIVPGITAASAMAARLGVSLTHRDHAQAVRFVTGHSKKGELTDTVDWHELADPATTTIFYMGARFAGRISRTLQDAGRGPETPVAVMAGITRRGEKSWTGHLLDLELGVNSLATEEPVLIGVGEVFADAGAAVEALRLEMLERQELSKI